MPVPEPKAGRNLPIAIATGLGLAGLIFATLFTSRPAFFVLALAAILLAQTELYRALREHGFHVALSLGVGVGAVLVLGAYLNRTEGIAIVLALSVPATVLWFLAGEDRAGARDGISATLFGVLYVPFFGAHVVMMSRLPHGPALTIAYIGAIAFYDIGAYAAGSLFGAHPMAPSISPKKTWEGTLGATLLVVVLALIVGPHLGQLTVATSLALAGVVTLLAPLGDLAESTIKRDLAVKDMGSLLPGHGGLLDRIDALIFVAPAAYWLMRAAVV